MDVLMTFPRLKALSDDPKFIMKAVRKSQAGLIQVDQEGNRMRRNPNNPAPEMNDANKKSVENRTLFVTGFDRENSTLDELLEFFEGKFDQVGNVRMRMSKEIWKGEKVIYNYILTIYLM